MYESRMIEKTTFETPANQPCRSAMGLTPKYPPCLAKQAVLCFVVIFVLLLTAGPAFAATGGSSSPAAFFTYKTAVGSGFGGPCGTAVDNSGNVFVADFGRNGVGNAIYEIVAVNGAVSASSTVNQIASSFVFDDPCDVKLDASGDLFVADMGSGNVSEINATNGAVSATSTVTTIDSFSQPSGLAFDASGNLFVATYGGGAVYEIPANSSGVIVAGTTPVATAVPAGGWKGPWSVATDASGDLFVTDYIAGKVYEIVAVSGSVSSSSAVIPVSHGFESPTGIAVDSQGNVFVADLGWSALYVISPSNGPVSASTQATLIASNLGSGASTYGLSLDGNGNLFLANWSEGAVIQISIRSLNLGTVAAGSRSAVFPMRFTANPGGVLAGWSVVNGGTSGNAFSDAGGGTCVAGNSYTNGQSCVIFVRFAPNQAGTFSGAVTLFGSSGEPFLLINLTGTGTAPQISFLPGTRSAALNTMQLGYPDASAVDAIGNVFVADTNSHSLCELAIGSKICTLIGNFDSPEGVAIDGAGNLYVADAGQNMNDPAIYELIPESASNYYQRTISTAVDYPTGIAVDGSGNVYVADDGASAIYKLSSYYNYYGFSQTTIASGLISPWAVAVDGSGDIFVAGNSPTFSGAADGNVYMLTPLGSGYSVNRLGSGWVDPNGIAVDAVGAILVADDDAGNGSGSVAVLHPVVSGGVTTYQQDTWLPNSQVSSPEGIGLDQNGNLYVVDGNTDNAYKYDTADAPSLSFASTDVGATSSLSEQHISVINTGNAALDISAVGFPASFPEDTSNNDECAAGSVVAPSQSCSLTIDFLPKTAGTNSGVVWLTDNALNVAASKQSLGVSGFGFGIAAAISSPGPGSTLTGTSVTFNWSEGNGVSEYWLYVGTNGAGSANIYNSSAVTNFANVTNLPIYGQTVYVRLLSKIAGVWQYIDYTYTAVNLSVPATMQTPAPGTTLPGASATFTWTAGQNASEYWLYVGTRGAGSTNIYNSMATTTSANVTTLPVSGGTVYVRLLSKINGAWQYNDYTYTAQ